MVYLENNKSTLFFVCKYDALECTLSYLIHRRIFVLLFLEICYDLNTILAKHDFPEIRIIYLNGE